MNTSQDKLVFPLQRYTFNWQATSDIYLPAFSGSALRGNFGNILRKTVCFTKYETCLNCPLINRCSYGKLYDTVASGDSKHIKQAHPYVIEPLEYNRRFIPNGEHFSFSMVLLGDTYKDLPLYIFIWEKVFGQIGLRASRKVSFAKLLNVTADNQLIYDNQVDEEERVVIDHVAKIETPQLLMDTPQQLDIVLETPLRLQGRDNDNKSIIIGCQTFDARAFISGIIKKSQQFFNSYAIDYPIPYIDISQIEMINRNLHWVKTLRYSGSQKQEMEFFGVIGSFSLRGTQLDKLMPLLILCQHLHLGKSSTFGFGKFNLQFSV